MRTGIDVKVQFNYNYLSLRSSIGTFPNLTISISSPSNLSSLLLHMRSRFYRWEENAHDQIQRRRTRTPRPLLITDIVHLIKESSRTQLSRQKLHDQKYCTAKAIAKDNGPQNDAPLAATILFADPSAGTALPVGDDVALRPMVVEDIAVGSGVPLIVDGAVLLLPGLPLPT